MSVVRVLTGRADRPVLAGLALGFLADRLFGDPQHWHPVAGFGRLAAALEQRTHRDHRAAGAGHVAVLVGAAVATGAVLERVAADRPLLRAMITAAAAWTVLGGRSLEREAGTLHRLLTDDDLAGARVQITHLVGRDPSGLSADELARACVESVAENTSDAVVAPLFWGGVAGVPGLLGYRAVNTLDAMIGHRSERYRRFGWAAARLDDLVNWLPARLAGGLVVAMAPLLGGSSADALQAVRTQAGRHPSPNAGVVESAFAGALGVRLGGVNRYHGVSEDRGELGFGRRVRPDDIPRSTELARLVGGGSLLAALALAGVSRVGRRGGAGVRPRARARVGLRRDRRRS